LSASLVNLCALAVNPRDITAERCTQPPLSLANAETFAISRFVATASNPLTRLQVTALVRSWAASVCLPEESADAIAMSVEYDAISHLEPTLPAADAGSALVAVDAQLLTLAIDALPVGIIIVGPDQTIVLVNDGIEGQFGYDRRELVGRSIGVLLPEALAATREDFDRHWPRPDRSWVQEELTLIGRRQDGTRFPLTMTRRGLRTPDSVFTLFTMSEPVVTGTARTTRDQHIDFERLIAELSIKFINLPSEQIVEALGTALRRVGERFEVDLCTFFRIPAGEAQMSAISAWRRRDEEPAIPPVLEHFPWTLDTLLTGKTLGFSGLGDVPHATDRSRYDALGIRSAVFVPLSAAGRVAGALAFMTTPAARLWTSETLHAMQVMAAVFGSVLARCEHDESLRQMIVPIERARDQLRAENVYLRREVEARLGTSVIIGRSAALARVMDQARQVAATDSTVLLLGETGTGKELIATHIHELSSRSGRVVVRVNCSAIPHTLLESELFGREKGAFTGALARQLGRFELANHSTIFLDEIGDLPLDVQVKLLRVIEERIIERLGSPKGIHVDVRIIAATHRDLQKRIAEDAFREDLFYRLNVFPIEVPPLRDRNEDIPLLVWRFVDEFSKAFGKRVDAIGHSDMAALQRYPWPGNIRELRNVVERAMIVANGPRLTIAMPSTAIPSPAPHTALMDVERDHIRTVLEKTGWRIRGANGAAQVLGLKPTTLEARMLRLGLHRPKSA
jgi:PAS domain S-box-containing protein